MILEFKKYALLALLFVGFASVSPAGGAMRLTHAEAIKKCKELKGCLAVITVYIKMLNDVLTFPRGLVSIEDIIERNFKDIAKENLKHFHNKVISEGLSIANIKEKQDALEKSIADLEDVLSRISPTESSSNGRVIRVSEKCGSCQKIPLEPKVCAGCKGVVYCSTVCQRSHWPTHKAPCKTYQAERKVAQEAASKK